MASLQWPDQLRAELGRQGLPTPYISRLVEELSDHVADIASEDSSVDVDINGRLGTPQQLAVIAKAEYRHRTFAGRHRLLTFMAGPIFAMIATMAVVWLVAFVFLESFDTVLAGRIPGFDEVGSAAVRAAVLHVFHSLDRFLPFALPAWLFVRLGRRTGMPVWSAGACGLIALAAIGFFSVLMPAKDPAFTRWVAGFDAATGYDGEIGLGRLLQGAAPLALASWVMWRHSLDNQRRSLFSAETKRA